LRGRLLACAGTRAGTGPEQLRPAAVGAQESGQPIPSRGAVEIARRVPAVVEGPYEPAGSLPVVVGCAHVQQPLAFGSQLLSGPLLAFSEWSAAGAPQLIAQQPSKPLDQIQLVVHEDAECSRVLFRPVVDVVAFTPAGVVVSTRDQTLRRHHNVHVPPIADEAPVITNTPQ
jgi:hypothetical protein